MGEIMHWTTWSEMFSSVWNYWLAKLSDALYIPIFQVLLTIILVVLVATWARRFGNAENAPFED